MKKTLLLLLLFTFLNIFSQNNFEKAYFITNTEERVECFINNVDWKLNPVKFKYRINDNDKIKTHTIKEIKEFGIYSISKFIRVELDIDQSSDNINHYSNTKNPLFSKETVFLKVLIENEEASLYYYEQESKKRFFYRLNGNEIKQLIYKRYVVNVDEIHENIYYKQQLKNSLICSELSNSDFNRLKYKQANLIDLFNIYNLCKKSSTTVELDLEATNQMINLSARIGLGKSALSLYNGTQESKNTDFDSKISIRAGVEIELVLPYNNDKWSVFADPTYQYYKTEKNVIHYPNSSFEREEHLTVNYQSIEIPVGLRQYFIIDEESKMFIDASFVFDISVNNSSIEFKELSKIDIWPENCFAFGVGFKKDNKYSLSFHYNTKKNIIQNSYFNWSSKYQSVSLMLGYQLF